MFGKTKLCSGKLNYVREKFISSSVKLVCLSTYQLFVTKVFRSTFFTSQFGPPALVGTGPIRSSSLVIILSYYPFFSKMALRIFMIFCIKLQVHKGTKVTKPDFWKKIRGSRYWGKGGQKWGFSGFSQKRL